ncbi:CAP domain-containing protein [Hutsoniella sourekii]
MGLVEGLSERGIAKAAFNTWKNSPGHYANMMNDQQQFFAFGAVATNKYRPEANRVVNQGPHYELVYLGNGYKYSTTYPNAFEKKEIIDGIECYVIRANDGSLISYLPVNDADIDILIKKGVDHTPKQMNAMKDGIRAYNPYNDPNSSIHANVTDPKAAQQPENSAYSYTGSYDTVETARASVDSVSDVETIGKVNDNVTAETISEPVVNNEAVYNETATEDVAEITSEVVETAPEITESITEETTPFIVGKIAPVETTAKSEVNVVEEEIEPIVEDTIVEDNNSLTETSELLVETPAE